MAGMATAAAQSTVSASDLTPRQAECLAAIRVYFKQWGQCPTRTELSRTLGVSKIAAHALVMRLERSGRILIIPGQWRNIRIKDAR